MKIKKKKWKRKYQMKINKMKNGERINQWKKKRNVTNREANKQWNNRGWI